MRRRRRRGLLDPDNTTTWNPGILADTPTGKPLGPDGLPVRTTTCASVPAQSGDATPAIKSALSDCAGKHQVVVLAAGTYSVSSTLSVPSGVVLRRDRARRVGHDHRQHRRGAPSWPSAR